MRSPDREVIPQLLNAGDACAQDEAIFSPGNFEHARRYTGFQGDLAAWEATERSFHAAAQDVLAGRRAWDDPSWLELARAVCWELRLA